MSDSGASIGSMPLQPKSVAVIDEINRTRRAALAKGRHDIVAECDALIANVTQKDALAEAAEAEVGRAKAHLENVKKQVQEEG